MLSSIVFVCVCVYGNNNNNNDVDDDDTLLAFESILIKIHVVSV